MGMCRFSRSFIVPGLGQKRGALKLTPTPEDVDICAGDRRPPGSSVKSMFKAPAQPAPLNGSLYFLHRYIKTGIQQGEVQKKTSISFTVASLSRMHGNSSYWGVKAIIELRDNEGLIFLEHGLLFQTQGISA